MRKLHHFSLLALFLLILVGVSNGQDGRIVAFKPFRFDENFVKERVKANPLDEGIFENVNVRDITYLSDGLKVKGFVAEPIGGRNLPVIIYNRGGTREFGALGEFEIYFMAKFASWGYVVIASQYRGCCGSEGKDELGGADVSDVVNLIPSLNQITAADKDRIGMWGWSRGGMMTFIAMTRTDRIRAVVVGAPAINQFAAFKRTDGEAIEKEVFEVLIPNYRQDKDSELRKRSPLFWTEKIPKNVPILLFQGSSDWRVPAGDTLLFVEKLFSQKNPIKLIFYPGADHGIREFRDETTEQTKSWFDKYVRDKAPLPDMELHGR